MLDRLNYKTESNADYKARIRELKKIHRPKKRVYRSKNPLPQSLLDRHPDLTEKDIKLIRKMILDSYSRRVRQANIIDIVLPHLGRFKTHGNRIKKYAKKTRKADKKRKREEQKKKLMTIESLLF